MTLRPWHVGVLFSLLLTATSFAQTTESTTLAEPVTTATQPQVEQAEDAHTTLTLPSGVSYQDVLIGSGAETSSSQQMAIHYTLRLEDGRVADSSREKLLPVPFKFTPGTGEAIAGMEQGVTGMRVGGKRHVIIPPSAGYGEKGTATIPANSTLFFEVELVGAK